MHSFLPRKAKYRTFQNQNSVAERKPKALHAELFLIPFHPEKFLTLR